jgi:hypothetical protein
MDDSLGNAYPLTITSGEIADQPFTEMCYPAFLLGETYSRGYSLLWYLPEPGAMDEIFIDSQVGMQRRNLGQKTDELFCFFRSAAQVDAVDKDIPLCLVENTAKDVHSSRFAGAVGTKQTENAILGDLEIDIADGPRLVITMRQVLYSYNCFTHKFEK